MRASTRKLFVALAVTAVGLAPLAACSSGDNSSQDSSNVTPLIQIGDANGNYSAEQDREWMEVTGKDPNVETSTAPKAILNAATPKDFAVPGDIEPGTYVFKPYSRGGSFYMSAGYQKLDDIQYIEERTLVTIPSGSLILERVEVFEPTAEQLETLSHIDLSGQ